MSNVPVPVGYPVLQKSWFARNWKWFVPTLVLVLLLAAAACIGGLMSLAFGLIKNSDPYQHGIAVATHNPKVIRQLGSPVQTGWLVSGSVNISGSSGSADLEIPLKGTLHKATVYVVAKRSAGLWSYERLEVEVEGNPECINLLAPATSLQEK